MVLSGKTVRQIHKEIYKLTIKQPKMYLFMEKVANKAVKNIDRRKNKEDNSVLFILLFKKMDYNGKVKKLINHETMETAEKSKNKIVNQYIEESRDAEKWLYLASSHNDCAEDHQAYQGKLYYDEGAPSDIVKYAKNRGLHSIQWVMDGPVWFITRPNCRHYFKSFTLDTIKKNSLKELKHKYKMHSMTGDRKLSTPRKIVTEELRDRLKLLQAMYNENPSEYLHKMIQKTKLLLKKHLNQL